MLLLYHTNWVEIYFGSSGTETKILNLTRLDFKYPMDFGNSIRFRRIQIRTLLHP